MKLSNSPRAHYNKDDTTVNYYSIKNAGDKFLYVSKFTAFSALAV